MNPGLCLILRIYVISFCSGRAKSRCEAVLAVIFDEVYRQHSFGFHTFRTVIIQFSLTLTSSTRFGEYLNSGTTYTKMSQTGRIPRPAGLGQAGRPPPPRNVILQLCTYGPKHKIKPIQECLAQESQVETERLEPSQVGSICSDKQINQDPNQLEEQYTTINQRDRAMEG